jgi:hypothetical protein
MAAAMPQEMREVRTSTYKVASHFAIEAPRGCALVAYKALQVVTAASIECHAGYKVE